MCHARWFLAAAAFPALLACGGGKSEPQGGSAGVPDGLAVTPGIALVSTRGLVPFATLPAGASVTWAVDPPGCGTIDAAGVYGAPDSPSTCRVIATLHPEGIASAPAVVTVRESSCATEPMRGTGTTYYFCDCGAGADADCHAGSDLADGLTPITPKPGSGIQARYNSMPAGDTVALCRGGSFASPYGTGYGARIYNPNCTVSSTCDLRDYTPPAHPEWAADQTKRPILRSSGYGLFWSDEPQARPNGGYRAFNLQITGSGFGIGWGQNVTDVDVCNVFIRDLSGTGVTYWQNPQRTTVRQSQFARITGQGVLGGCTDCTLDGNYFANDSYGASNNRDHPLYITSDSGRLAQRMRIVNNEIHGCPPGMTQGTVLLVVHGNHEDLLIENNLVVCDNPTGDVNSWGIGVDDGGYGEATTFARTIVRRNWVMNNLLGIELSQAHDSVVESNLIVMAASSAGDGIAIGNVPPGAGDASSANVTVRQNTIYYPGSGSGGRGISVIRDTGHVVVSNAIYFASPSGGQCFNYPLSAASYGLLSNNACNATWNTSYDSNRIALTESPFEAAGSDYRPRIGSPLHDRGNPDNHAAVAVGQTTWSPSGLAATRTAPFDVGAYER